MPYLIDAAEQHSRARSRRSRLILRSAQRIWRREHKFFGTHSRAASIQVIEGFTWDCLAQAEVALAASGTVTIEAALLGAPMVTFYRVNALSWILGRWLVRRRFCRW